MALYRPTELKAFLKHLATHAKKGLSQNFLIDGNILRKMTAAAGVTAGDLVVEIGPGPGALTECLLACGAHVLAIERDTIFAKALQDLPVGSGQLDIFCDDILQFPLAAHLTTLLANSGRRAKVVANLPYHLTSPILGLLLPLHAHLESIHVMVQEEVARRLTAQAGTKDYSALTLFTQLYGGSVYCFGVGRRCFMPVPKVDSAVVKVTLMPPPLDIQPQLFLQFVHRAFGQRRKTLKSALHPLWEREAVTAALLQLALSPQIRAEELSLAQFFALYRSLGHTEH